MFHRLDPLFEVEVRSEICFRSSQFLKQALHPAVDARRGSIDFHAITSRNEDNLGQFAAQLQTAAATTQSPGGDRQLFANRNGCSLVTESGNKEVHWHSWKDELRGQAADSPCSPNFAIGFTNCDWDAAFTCLRYIQSRLGLVLPCQLLYKFCI